MPAHRLSPSGPFIAAPEVANLSDLAAFRDTTDDLVWVESLLCYWHRNATSVLAPDGITVIAAAAGGNWERIVPTTAPDWLSQAAWYIDSATGDDENSGALGFPLATADELARRLSVGELDQATTVTIAAATVLSRFELDVQLGLNGSMIVIGEPTVLVTDTVATYADRVHATPTATRLTATGIADWTPYEGRRLRVTQGTGAGAHAWVSRADPQSAGVDVARTSVFATFPFGISLDPVPGDTFVIESLPSIGHLSIHVRGLATIYATPRLVLRDVSMGNTLELTAEVGDFGFGAIVFGCEMTTPDPNESVQLNCRSTAPGYIINACTVQGATGAYLRGANFNASVFRDTNFDVACEISAPFPLSCGNNLFDGMGQFINTPGHTFYDTQWFDTGGVAIQTNRDVALTDSISGNGNTIGILVGGDGTQHPIDIAYNETQNLLGTTTDIQIRGSSNLNLSWTDMPFDGDSQKGTGQLVAGTLDVPARGANVRGVVVSKATPAGNPQGQLSAPTASRAAAQFTVNAVDATGAVVATDTSTFDWYIPPMARGIRIFDSDNSAAAG